MKQFAKRSITVLKKLIVNWLVFINTPEQIVMKHKRAKVNRIMLKPMTIAY